MPARPLLVALSLTLTPPALAQDPEPTRRPDPTSAYAKQTIQGFTILVNKEVPRHKAESVAAREELESQLKAIVRDVPPRPLRALRSVPIWVEWRSKLDGAAEFHP